MHFSAQSPALCPSLLPGGAPLGAARHARAKHAGGEAGAHVDTRGQLISRTLTTALNPFFGYEGDVRISIFVTNTNFHQLDWAL